VSADTLADAEYWLSSIFYQRRTIPADELHEMARNRKIEHLDLKAAMDQLGIMPVQGYDLDGKRTLRWVAPEGI
jgi:hypothetical protein